MHLGVSSDSASYAKAFARMILTLVFLRKSCASCIAVSKMHVNIRN